ncbi:uncharacterized protein CDV56_105777 [Aspergillus thermomutatus]|uniref:Uncharacterized protein n=1 Tax=Aspergillus thermomutatus TaxID=41047 RepID=A0A397GL93_ASPTH|nr:uncharacterized protein CDV56_105777 [Aspergillus thermomutatus]RHZ51802.1 hypothetical protein CDV56_105777 [Aspergillus thermomutatus]
MYQLTAEDLDDTHEDDTPVIRAAAKPNPAILEAILACYAASSNKENLPLIEWRQIDSLSPNTTVNMYGRIQSPINAAIGANLPDNVRLLLAAGADPNSIKARDMADYSIGPLTEAELDKRRHGFPHFWTEPNIPKQGLPMGRPSDRALTALELIAKTGNLEILDLLQAAGVEESA